MKKKKRLNFCLRHPVFLEEENHNRYLALFIRSEKRRKQMRGGKVFFFQPKKTKLDLIKVKFSQRASSDQPAPERA